MFGRKTSKILVIKTDGLAHFVAAEPTFEAIRQAYPQAQISLLTTAALQRISRASPYFYQVAALPNMRDPEARKEFIKQLKAAKFERVFDLSSDDTGKRLYGAMGAFGPKWHAAAQNPLNKRRNSAAFAPPDTDAALKSAAVECVERLPDFRWVLEARKDSANMQPSWYGISGVFGLLLPGADPERRWTAAGYGGLANIMSQSGVMPVLAGPKTLHAFGDEIANHAPQLVDLTGKTDHLQLAALAHEAAFFITDHAEEMHLAVSVGAEGVIIANASSMPTAPEGRHVVSLTSQAGAGAVDPIFVWRTLSNMGLISTQTIAPQSVGAR
jgi:ADP-heptose:LPS heptosyltransferase